MQRIEKGRLETLSDETHETDDAALIDATDPQLELIGLQRGANIRKQRLDVGLRQKSMCRPHRAKPERDESFMIIGCRETNGQARLRVRRMHVHSQRGLNRVSL